MDSKFKKYMQSQEKFRYLEQGQRIAELKDYFGYNSDLEFARFLGFKKSDYSNHKIGRTCRVEMVLALAEKCAVSPLWLLTGQGDRFIEGRDRPNRDWIIAQIMSLPLPERIQIAQKILENSDT